MNDFHRNRLGWAALAALSLGLSGCAAPQGQKPSGLAELPALGALKDCASLKDLTVARDRIGLPTLGVRVTEAVTVAPRPAAMAGERYVQAMPGYCRVTGEIAPVDPRAGPIRFQISLPERWNQKSLQVGGGGLNGKLPDNLAAVASGGSPTSGAYPPNATYPLVQGYAVYGGDSGHQDPGTEATWALNAEAWENFGHASLKKTHDAAFAVMQAFYGQTPRVSYFMGQSQGGREAMEVAQRYPDDYDGVVATAPLIGYTAHVVHKTLLATTQTGAGWIPPAKLAAIGREVVRQCDALDGLADGVVNHYRACQALFDPQRRPDAYAAIRCADGGDAGASCLSDAQIRTLHQMHAPLAFGFPLANGWSTFPGYGLGRESQAGFLNIQPQPNSKVQPALGQPGATVRFGILKDPGVNLVDFDPRRYQARIQAASALIDSTNPDLSRFFARGGRLIIKTSPSDYNSHPQIMMMYYDAMVARLGQAAVDRHVRFYVMPFTGHSGDGSSVTTGQPVPQHVDLVGMAFDWVEKGRVPPDAPIAEAMSQRPPHEVSARKPMCRYPLYPHYLPGGDPRSATSYECRP